MPTFIITGANGQVGANLTTQLKIQFPNSKIFALNKSQLDITNLNSVKEILKKIKPNIVFNCSAFTAVDLAETEQNLCFQINYKGAENLATVTAELKATLIHISTDYVFDGNKNSPYFEDDLPNPLNIYGKSKLLGEKAIQEINPKHIIVRTSWVFAENYNNFVNTMLKLSSKNELKIVSDQIGSPTFAPDIANVLIAIAKINSNFGLYHFSGLPFVSWFDFANEIFNLAKEKNIIQKSPKLIAIPTSEYPTPAKRPLYSMLDCSKIAKTFTINPSNWQQALNLIIK